MRRTLICLLGLSALLGTSAVNPCLDPTDSDYSCELSSNDYHSGRLSLYSCDLTDEDVDDIASCLDDVGRENILELNLFNNELSTLPEGIFGGLTALEGLGLSQNDLTTLPEGVFADLTALSWLNLESNALTNLPEGIFGGLTALEGLHLDNNALTTLPEGIFGDLAALEGLYMSANALTTLPEGIFGGLPALHDLDLSENAVIILPEGIFGDLAALEWLWLSYNALTSLADGIFEGLTALEQLWLEGNALECLPVIPTALEELSEDHSSYGSGRFTDGIRVGPYGDECGCSIPCVADVCGEGVTCTPGSAGYVCESAPASAPAPTPTVETADCVPATSAPLPALDTFTPEPAPGLVSEDNTSSGEKLNAKRWTAVVGAVVGGLVLALQ